MNKLYIFIAILFAGLSLSAQQANFNPYAPMDMSLKDWKYAMDVQYDNHNNSNSLINEFSFALNNSEFISDALKDKQMSKFDGLVTANRTSKANLGFWLNGKNNSFYYFGLDAQQVLDGQLDANLIGLVLYGNKPYAGKNLSISNSEYSNLYFNRVKAGMGKTFGSGDIHHTISGVIGFTVGQNFDYLNVENANVFTQADGEYLELDIRAETKLGDTVWGDYLTINGMGASVDLHYSMSKEKDFFFAVNIRNLGFINWNKNPFTATADTNFYFEGIANDTTNNQEIPDDFSEDNLRDIIFTNPDYNSFSQVLPFDINITGGKYFSEGKLYIGLNTTFYPSLISKYRAELFATYHFNEKFNVTPIIAYSSFNKVNIGLAVSAHLWESLYLRAGTVYLNSMFMQDAPVGQGGFVSIVFVR